MALRRISFADLRLGHPLPWDLFGVDQRHGPLLRKGQVLTDQAQLSRWLESGLFAGEEPPPSVLQMLNQTNQRLETLLNSLSGTSNAERDLHDVARGVIDAVEQNADIALACIFLNQIAGTYAVRHCVETAVLALLVARAMEKSARDIQVITAAALTMNVGMLRHSEDFQNKRSLLTREELAIIQRHPAEGAEMLSSAGVDDDEWLGCVMMHHENDDGSGYPGGKTSGQISQNAKLIALADRYCAHVSARNYRRSILPDQALSTLFIDPAQPIDPLLGQQFVRQLGKYPPGSLVQLENGETGVVIERQGQDSTLRVHMLRDAGGVAIAPEVLPFAARRSTIEPGFNIVQALHEDEAGVRFSMKNVWGDQARL